jgi:hypothetical protein
LKLKAVLLALFVAGFAVSIAVAGNASFAKKPKKVVMCHLTGSKKLVSIVVSRNAVKAHLRKGDKLGACPATPKTKTRTVTVTAPGTTVTVTAPCTTTTTTGSTSTTTGSTSSTTSSTTTSTTTSTSTTGSTSTSTSTSTAAA